MKSKQTKQYEADVRKAERGDRTIRQQLALISTRRGESKKEVERLKAELAKYPKYQDAEGKPLDTPETKEN